MNRRKNITLPEIEDIYGARIPISVFVAASAFAEFVFMSVVSFIYYKYIADVAEFNGAYFVFAMMSCVTYIIILIMKNGFEYESLFHFRKRLLLSMRCWGTAVLVMVCIMFFLKHDVLVSRYWVLVWCGIGVGVIALFALILKSVATFLFNRHFLEQRIVIVGSGDEAQHLIDSLNASARGIHICGTFDDRSDDRSPPLPNYPKLGSIDALVAFARKVDIDLLIVDIPLRAENRLMGMLKKLWILPINIRISAASTLLRFHKRSYSYIGNVQLHDIFDKPLSDGDVIIKWMFDKFFGILALIVLSPIMALTAILIKLNSPGSVLFKQIRYGFNNEPIEVYKFRSMYTNQSDFAGAVAVTKTDPRVTRVGRFIRKTSIDELPQLFNVVFKGNLSLIGPRPHVINALTQNHLFEDVVDGYFARHKMKPGITGLAQVHGFRGEVDNFHKIQKRSEYDLIYIENWSILLDLYILFYTPISLFLHKENAY